MKPVISIIIPTYNAEKTLAKCLNSIREQSFGNFEVLLCNDGSTDDTGFICNEYHCRDKRFKVYHKINEGVSSARNYVLKYAEGEWITFIDSDDYIHPLYIENLYNSAHEKCHMVIQGFNYVNVNGQIIKNKSFTPEKLDIHSSWKAFHKFEIYDIAMPFAKLFRTDIIKMNNLKFDINISYGEDMLFMLHYIQYINNITFTNHTNYYYLYHNNNCLSFKEQSYQDLLYLFNNIINICEQNEQYWRYSTDNKFKSHNAIFLHRALSALYKKISKTTRKNRIAILNKAIASYKPYIYRLKRGAIKKKSITFVYYILNKKNIYLYDWMMYFAYKKR